MWLRAEIGAQRAEDEDFYFTERQKCGTAEIGRPERSERETLPAVATTVLFGLLYSRENASKSSFDLTIFLIVLTLEFA